MDHGDHGCSQKGWGTKRIAAELNDLGIPSPDEGRSRTENGHRHRVSGRWNPSTVGALLRNRAIIGELRYGVQSEGAHRRLGPDGMPRPLEEHDEFDGEPKVIFNAPDLVIRSSMPNVEPLIDVKAFDAAQQVLRERGKHQRGIAKIRDASKYPLSTRVFDLNCAHPMYGRSSGERRLYTCGRYVNSNGQHCDHNQVDAEAMLKFVLSVLRQKLSLAGGRDALRNRLVQISKAERQNPESDALAGEVDVLKSRLRTTEDEQKLVARNLGYAQSPTEFAAIRPLLEQNTREVEQLRAQLATFDRDARRKSSPRDRGENVEQAMALFDQMESLVVEDDAAREKLRSAFQRLNLNVWLQFGEGLKGQRRVRVLTGGVLTTGEAKLPCRPYDGTVKNDGDRHLSGGAIGDASSSSIDGVNETPSTLVNRAGDVSLSKVHRGDRI